MNEDFDISQILEAMSRCVLLREAGNVEAVMRSEFHSRLRAMFPSAADQSWINHYGEGTEAHTRVLSANAQSLNRFIDNLVGATTIEYESDLRLGAKRETGLYQVREHASGLLRAGVPVSQIRGVLSDTVLWYVYTVELSDGVDIETCTPNDVLLLDLDMIDVSGASEVAAKRFAEFLRMHLARQCSRPLLAKHIVLDVGLESSLYKHCIPRLEVLASTGRREDSSIELATTLWSQFVDHFEFYQGEFRLNAYVDEVYVGIVARLISANALQETALLSEQAELLSILTGEFFQSRFQLANMVEQDYFGWLTRPEFVGETLEIAAAIQRDLFAYDYSARLEEDLFGRLMAQLARRSERRLLGQEWTPQWLSRMLAKRCLDNLNEGVFPRVIDMCCGSGAILSETLKEVRERFENASIDELFEAVTGFDIDPLAVALAKTTWVMTLADEIKQATSPVVIPIFHADSLFAVTPISLDASMSQDNDFLAINLDNGMVNVPTNLVQPQCREMFDRLIDWAYDSALEARDAGNAELVTFSAAESFIDATAVQLCLSFTPEFRIALIDCAYSLVARMSQLAVANRNGIWAFILRNTYRPGLLTGQFNALVSNPPWLAMSRLSDNPYRKQLASRSELYDLNPAGSSHLHLEMAVTHLVHAVDRYLSTDAAIACLLPGTIYNATHFEKFRQRSYLRSERPVPMEVSEVWKIADGTFKYPGAAIIGRRRQSVDEVVNSAPAGFLADPTRGLEEIELNVLSIGETRTAWSLAHRGESIGIQSESSLPEQGADLMPRSTVCVEILSNAGSEFRVTTPGEESPWWFAVKDGKKLKGKMFTGHAAPRFLYRMAQSLNLLPFICGSDFAPVMIPAERNEEGDWQLFDVSDLRNQGLTQTSRRIATINDELSRDGNGKSIQERINERNKLSRQKFSAGDYLVLSGAGGQYVCAACLPIDGNEDLIIDQTLYWKITNEDEAWFRVAMLNSIAMTEAVRPFNPRGDFGERHLHTLPHRVLPAFDQSNEAHSQLGILAQSLASLARAAVAADDYLANPAKALSVRRRRLRLHLLETDEFKELEQICAALLGTTAFGGE